MLDKNWVICFVFLNNFWVLPSPWFKLCCFFSSAIRPSGGFKSCQFSFALGRDFSFNWTAWMFQRNNLSCSSKMTHLWMQSLSSNRWLLWSTVILLSCRHLSLLGPKSLCDHMTWVDPKTCGRNSRDKLTTFCLVIGSRCEDVISFKMKTIHSNTTNTPSFLAERVFTLFVEKNRCWLLQRHCCDRMNKQETTRSRKPQWAVFCRVVNAIHMSRWPLMVKDTFSC